MKRTVRQRHFLSPVGAIKLTAQNDMLTGVRIFPAGLEAYLDDSPILVDAEKQLCAYFNNAAHHFTVPLAPSTSHQDMAFRTSMIAIPVGQTISYGELARKTGSFAKAVGQACARNPFPIIVPCHRILPANGRLGNYSGGDGPETKSWLLAHEGAELPQYELF